jgi:hypothetical protein
MRLNGIYGGTGSQKNVSSGILVRRRHEEGAPILSLIRVHLVGRLR